MSGCQGPAAGVDAVDSAWSDGGEAGSSGAGEVSQGSGGGAASESGLRVEDDEPMHLASGPNAGRSGQIILPCSGARVACERPSRSDVLFRHAWKNLGT